MTDSVATYRLQLAAGLRLPRGSGLPFRTSPSSAPRTSISRRSLQARSGSTHGYDVVDPTRISEHLGRRGRVPLALRRGGRGGPRRRCSTSSRTTWRPRGGEPVLARPGAAREVLRLGSRQRLVPPILRRRRTSPACGSRTAECSRTTHAKVLELVRDGLDRRASHRSPRRARRLRAAYLERLRERGAEHVWVEKILEPGERLRLARRGDDGLRVPPTTSPPSSSTPPARSR